jgi:hypothetical protein
MFERRKDKKEYYVKDKRLEMDMKIIKIRVIMGRMDSVHEK